MKFNNISSSKYNLDKILKDLRLDWEVDGASPVSGLHNKKCGEIIFSEHKGIVRTDTCDPLSIMGKNYKIVQNKEIMEMLIASLDKEKSTRIEGGFFKNGERAWATTEDHDIKIKRFNGEIFGKALLEWSHNGEVAISLKFIIKLFIPNWKKIILAPFIPGNPATFCGDKFKHTPHVEENLKAAYKKAPNLYNKLVKYYNDIYSNPLNKSQMKKLLDKLYPDRIVIDSGKTIITPVYSDRKKSIIDRYTIFEKTFGSTQFNAVLAFNYYFDHETPVYIPNDTDDPEEYEKERRLMSILYGTAAKEKIRFLRAL